MKKPKVSIISICYNHERYIEDAIKGFLLQKTDFPIEIIIADDASTDKSQQIINKYADEYPGIIKPILRKKNIGAINNFVDALSKANGVFIAICEGDDYWIDDTKLQRQVDFLESHTNYALCFHPVRVVYEDGEVPDSIFPDRKNNFNTKRLLENNFIQTNTVVYRAQDYSRLTKNIMPFDWYLHLFHAQFGKIGFIDRTMAVYRKHSGGIWWDSHTSSLEFWQQNAQLHINFFDQVRSLYKDKGKTYLAAIKAAQAHLLDKEIDLLCIANGSRQGQEFIYKLLSDNPDAFLILLEGFKDRINKSTENYTAVIDELSNQNKILQLKNSNLQRENEKLKSTAHQLQTSMSWKVTKPLRRLSKFFVS